MHAPRAVLQPACSFSPGSLNLNAQGSAFSVGLSIVDSCDPANPVPIQPGSIGIVHVSRAGSLVLPDPASLQCPAADGSTTFETGLFEDLAARSVLGSSLSLKFDTPSDGNCQTLEGNRQDLGAVLSSVPDNTTAPICVAGVAGGQSFECCVSVKVLNKGNRR